MTKVLRRLRGLMEEVQRDEGVLALFLFGSYARGEEREDSDIDVCLVLQGRPDREEIVRKQIEYLRFHQLDLHIFQALPIYIRHRILREGKLIYVRDEDRLYEMAFRTAQAFEDYKHLYRDYLEEVMRAG